MTKKQPESKKESILNEIVIYIPKDKQKEYEDMLEFCWGPYLRKLDEIKKGKHD